jgi:hypothetical protein
MEVVRLSLTLAAVTYFPFLISTLVNPDSSYHHPSKPSPSDGSSSLQREYRKSPGWTLLYSTLSESSHTPNPPFSDSTQDVHRKTRCTLEIESCSKLHFLPVHGKRTSRRGTDKENHQPSSGPCYFINSDSCFREKNIMYREKNVKNVVSNLHFVYLLLSPVKS